jgi:secondary thiamine-phosphate synthase enzyme
MKVFQKIISVQTKQLNEFIKITDDVKKIVSESKIKNGMVFVNSLHNTAAVIIQENDSTIHRDLINTLGKIVPLKGKYEHDFEGNENATAHIKSNLLGTSVTVPLENNKLLLGTWQDVFFIELFETREREIIVTVIGE